MNQQKLDHYQLYYNYLDHYQHYSSSIETHLAVVRGLLTKRFLQECVNEKSSTERRS